MPYNRPIVILSLMISLILLTGCGGGGAGDGTSSGNAATALRGNVRVSLQLPDQSAAPTRKAPDDVLQYIYISLFQVVNNGTFEGGSGFFDYSAHEGIVECLVGNYVIVAMGLDANYNTRYIGLLGDVQVTAGDTTDAGVQMEEGSAPSSSQLEEAGISYSEVSSWNWNYVPGGGFDPTGISGITGFTVLPWCDTSIDIYFTVPENNSHTDYIVRRSTTSYPATHTDGEAAASGQLSTAVFPITDIGVSGIGTTYYYTIFTTDGTTYSEGLTSSTTVQNVVYTDSWMDIGGTNGLSSTVTGDKIRVFDQQGVFCGKAEVTTSSGNFDLIHCYYDDTLATPFVDEGGTDGESMVIYLNGRQAVSSPQAAWGTGSGQQLITLSAGQ